jgi:hypothetical protein
VGGGGIKPIFEYNSTAWGDKKLKSYELDVTGQENNLWG